MKTAILVIGFNRPDFLSQLLKSIEVEKRDVYIFIDGARNPKEDIEVDQCRSISTQFQNRNAIERNIKLNFQLDNLGCKVAVRSAIDWAFESERTLIILEDDIVIGNSFLRTMDVWLDRYSEDKNVFHLNGFSPIPRQFESTSSFLSRYPHVWGWATWRDRWLKYDRELSKWEEGKLHFLPGLNNQFLPEYFTQYWDSQIKLCIDGYDTWDVQWTFTQWLSGGYALTPGARLTGNVGFDNRATHTKSAGNSNRSIRPDKEFNVSDVDSAVVFNHELNAMQDFIEHNLGRSPMKNLWKLKLESIAQRHIFKKLSALLIKFLLKLQESRVYDFFDTFLKSISKIVPHFVHIFLKIYKLIYCRFLIRGIKFIYWRGLRRFLFKQ
jgi:hypothetical protein